MSRQIIETSPFFARMEEFGFFDAVEEHLPPEFTMIYEIARILEDMEHSLARALSPIMELTTNSNKDSSLELITLPHVVEAEEYEADLIRSVGEIRHIYPYQHLLPDEVFLQRIAERSLWMPRPRVPRNFKYQTDSDRYAPDDRKQKVYLLFDTSSSMQHHYRIHLARAITYLFLRRNQRELGTIFFRTFDIKVGELLVARDIPGFSHLISQVMHDQALGNGTSLQRALVTAISDISHESMLSDAQILVITDGVAHIDVDALRTAMGSNIVVNTVKIGRAKMPVDARAIEEYAYNSSRPDAQRMRNLLEQRRSLDASLRNASGTMRTESIKSQIGLIDSQISSLMQRISVDVEHQYNTEIQELSEVYVEIDDISAEEMFSFPEHKISELEQLAEALLEQLRTEHQVEDIKRAAILYDHLYLLMQYNKIDAPRLERYAKELESMLDQILNRPGEADQEFSITDMERIQLKNMIEGGVSSQKLSLARLIQILLVKLKRWWHVRRQARSFAAVLGRQAPRRREL